MKIGMMELIVIFVVALLVLGPEKLPVYAKKLGEALGQFRKYSEEATKDIKESIVTPLEEAQRPLREAMEPFTELEKSVKGNVKEVQDALKGIGKPKSTAADVTAAQEQIAENNLTEGEEQSAQNQTAESNPATMLEQIAAADTQTDGQLQALEETDENDVTEKEEIG